MKRIKITESQLKMLKTLKDKQKSVYKLTESQYKELVTSIKNGSTKTLNEQSYEIEDLEFYEQMMYFINSEFGEDGSGQVPEILASKGVSAQKLKLLLIGHGILKVEKDENGENAIKVMRKNLSKGLDKIKSEIFKNTEEAEKPDNSQQEIPQPEVKLDEEEITGQEPWEQDYSPEDDTYGYTDIDSIEYIDNQFVILKSSGQLILVDYSDIHSEMKHSDNPKSLLSHLLDDIQITKDPMDFCNSDTDAVYLTPETIEVIKHELYDFEELCDALDSVFSLDETTMTGDVGGSYETPSAWSKNPKKPRHSDKTSLDGGTFIKKQVGDDMSTIREHNNFKKNTTKTIGDKLTESLPKIKLYDPTKNNDDINEDIEFRVGRYPNLGKCIIMVSDSDNPKVRYNETSTYKNIAKDYGFKYDANNKVFYCSVDNIEKVKELRDNIDICKQTFSKIDELMGEMLEFNPTLDAKEIHEKVKSQLVDFYGGLDDELDAEKFLTNSIEYLNFISKFKKFHGRNFSMKNMLLIYLQRPGATCVAGSREWLSVDREVKKEEKNNGIGIFIPTSTSGKGKNNDADIVLPKVDTFDDSQLEGDADNATDGSPRQYFIFRKILFDITQTNNVNGEEEPANEPTWRPSNEPDERTTELIEIISELIKDDNITLTNDPAMGNEGGYSSNGGINISKGAEGQRYLKTLIHEYAHELLHWGRFSFDNLTNHKKISTAVKEIQAEGIAIGLMNHFGFDTQPSKVYLQGWREQANGGKVRDQQEIMIEVCTYILEKINAKKGVSDNQDLPEPKEMPKYEKKPYTKKTSTTKKGGYKKPLKENDEKKK